MPNLPCDYDRRGLPPGGYQLLRIPKRNGTYREVVSVPESTREIYRLANLRFLAIAQYLDIHNVSHGFMPLRSPVTNAWQHVGYDYTVSVDLKDFFDTVTHTHLPYKNHSTDDPRYQFIWNSFFTHEGFQLEKALNSALNKNTVLFVDGVAKQGLPTSPALANISAAPMDDHIVIECGYVMPGQFAYTRYADDLTISVDDRRNVDVALEILRRAVVKFDFAINERKTSVQAAKNGRRIITGVAVDEASVHPTRASKRRERAARHQCNVLQAIGLAEWNALKIPQRYNGVDAMRELMAYNVKFMMDYPNCNPRELANLYNVYAARVDSAKAIRDKAYQRLQLLRPFVTKEKCHATSDPFAAEDDFPITTTPDSACTTEGDKVPF